MPSPILVWFRQDLRLSDNPALLQAVATGAPLHFLYILDDADAGDQALGAASRWWLHHSLAALGANIKAHGGQLTLASGHASEVLSDLITRYGIEAIYWNRMYEPWSVARDTALKSDLKDKDIRVETFNGSLLHEPWAVKTKAGGIFSVFTPFWKAVQALGDQETPGDAPDALNGAADVEPGQALKELDLLPTKPNWAAGFEPLWQPGESGARAMFEAFLSERVSAYSDGRNFPATPAVSRLSAHLHFGEISPRQVWYWTRSRMESGAIPVDAAWSFLRELGWRDFNRHLLFNNPHTVSGNFKPAFDAFPWQDDEDAFKAWTKGRTGYPFVDAGMRELWQTGIMHNRVRMVTASFLIKHLLTDWRKGEAWFRNTLIDADLANNVGGWQWTAGCGADASPYFRIFNPFTQGEKFDGDGSYTRKFVPELAALPDKWLHRPWEAPDEVLRKAGVVLGKTYPKPIVDHGKARERALRAYETTKSVNSSSQQKVA